MGEISRDQVASVLLAHADDLRKRQFTLISIPDRVESRSLSFSGEELLVVDAAGIVSTQNARGKLAEDWPHLDKLLSFRPGAMVCAGGAITAAILERNANNSGDADIFFYGITTEEAEATIREIFRWVDREHHGAWYGSRNQNVTTLWIVPNEFVQNIMPAGKERIEFLTEEGRKYQFIHRVFPDKGSVIGGFDISACMFMYDGFEILGLPLSLFCLKTGAIILDVSRRSPSLEMRLKKYARNYGFEIVIPCMSSAHLLQLVRTSPFPQISENTQGVTVIVGGTLRVSVHTAMERDDILFPATSFAKQRTEPTDYDNGEHSYTNLSVVNSINAVQNRLNLLTWVGESYEELFEEPVLRSLDTESLKSRLKRINRWCSDDRSGLYRWFGRERAYKTDHCISRADYPDVFGEPGRTADHRDFSSWPLLLSTEIGTVAEVVKARCQRYQIELIDRNPRGSYVTWIGPNQNPGRQFTASFNPNPDGKGWYSPNLARPLRIGIPHNVFRELKLLSCYGGSVPSFSRDILRVICTKLWELLADEGRTFVNHVNGETEGPQDSFVHEDDEN